MGDVTVHAGAARRSLRAVGGTAGVVGALVVAALVWFLVTEGLMLHGTRTGLAPGVGAVTSVDPGATDVGSLHGRQVTLQVRDGVLDVGWGVERAGLPLDEDLASATLGDDLGRVAYAGLVPDGVTHVLWWVGDAQEGRTLVEVPTFALDADVTDRRAYVLAVRPPATDSFAELSSGVVYVRGGEVEVAGCTTHDRAGCQAGDVPAAVHDLAARLAG